MGGDVITAAKTWAKAGIRNPAYAAKLQCDYEELLESSRGPNGFMQINSATKNGVSQTATHALNPQQRMDAMGIALDWIALGVVPSTSRALGRF
jgi:hypothetical protein